MQHTDSLIYLQFTYHYIRLSSTQSSAQIYLKILIRSPAFTHLRPCEFTHLHLLTVTHLRTLAFELYNHLITYLYTQQAVHHNTIQQQSSSTYQIISATQ